MSDYSVGRGRPPVQHQFKPGKSGNPGGRPKRHGRKDAMSILDEPETISRNGEEITMQPFEAMMQKMLAKALQEGELRAIIYLIKMFDRYGLLADPLAQSGSVITLPNSMPWSMALDMLYRFGEPPWTKAQIDAGRQVYVAQRTEEERLIDEALGYADL